MKVIQPNCRIQFTAEDINFITSHLGRPTQSNECLIGLLTDESTRDLILDDDGLFHALLENRGCLEVSMHFYFYVLVRHVLRRSGIEDRAVADYVAELLSEFSCAERARCQVPGHPQGLHYFVDMLAALQTADDRTSFMIRAHIGNYALFLAGVFPEHIRHRAERRGAPSLRYFEELGRTNFRVASDHRLAHRFEVDGIFATLAEQFQKARLALNDLSDRLLSLSSFDYTASRLLETAYRN